MTIDRIIMIGLPFEHRCEKNLGLNRFVRVHRAKTERRPPRHRSRHQRRNKEHDRRPESSGGSAGLRRMQANTQGENAFRAREPAASSPAPRAQGGKSLYPAKTISRRPTGSLFTPGGDARRGVELAARPRGQPALLPEALDSPMIQLPGSFGLPDDRILYILGPRVHGGHQRPGVATCRARSVPHTSKTINPFTQCIVDSQSSN